ncbi:guanine nucleotide binding protein, alpha subunit [Mycena epipterygia]|nr:guanine nucleotide binding protein, alpha subunit [Mycena epipterygia]
MVTSARPADALAAAQNAKIDEILAEERSLARLTTRILVLGIQGSGKATFMRQFRAIHKQYRDDERHGFKVSIHASVVRAARQILSQVPEEICSAPHVLKCQRVISSSDALSEEVAAAVHTLWTDDALKAVSPLDTSAIYFLNALDRISAPDYTPTDSDILHCKAHPPPPLDELSVEIDSWTYSLVCVRQNSSTRRKWLPCFDTIACLVFVLNLEEYDRPDLMREAVDLFGWVCFPFSRTVVHLLLNKPESLGAKLVASPLAAIYPDYAGGDDESAAVQFISQPFRTLIANVPHRLIYTHIVDVADADASRVVIDTIANSYELRVGCVWPS